MLETKRSLFSRIYAALRRLDRTLDSFWSYVVSLFSKLRSPRREFSESISPQSDTKKEGEGAPKQPSVVPNVVPPPPSNGKPENGRYRDQPWWMTVAEIIGIAGVVAYAIISYCQWQAQKDAIKIDQRAWLNVTVNGMDAQTIKANVPINGKTFLSNTGKTPAKKIFSEFEIQFLENSEAPSLRYDNSSIKDFIGFMAPRPPSEAVALNVF